MIYAFVLTKQGIECNVLTGMSYFDSPYLHAVLSVKNRNTNKIQILDFNYDLVMDYDLFLKLYSFEVWSSVSGQKFLDDRDIIEVNGVDLKDYQLLLAYDDAIRYKQEKLTLLGSKQKL